MALDTDIDDQDQAETFDEETSGSDQDLETDYLLDRDTEDVTRARGDADLDGDDEALDADELSDEALENLDDEDEEDDLDDEGADSGPLASDDIPDFSSDRDFGAPGEARAVAAPEDDAETIAMGDMTGYAGTERVSDLESDTLSDADLKELDYMDDDADEDRVLTKGGEAPDADKAADAATPVPDKPTVRHDNDRLDEGLEETFPASDPVSAKHIT